MLFLLTICLTQCTPFDQCSACWVNMVIFVILRTWWFSTNTYLLEICRRAFIRVKDV